MINNLLNKIYKLNIVKITIIIGILIYGVWLLSPSPNNLSIKESVLIMNIIKKGDVNKLNYKLKHELNPNSCLCNRSQLSLLQKGSFPSDIIDVPIITFACTFGTPKIVQALLDHGAKVNNTDGDDAPLMRAVEPNNNPEIVKMLLENGAHVNQRDSNKETALMAASMDGMTKSADNRRLKIFELLLKYGADPNIKNFQGETALTRSVDTSIHDSNLEEVILLIRYHANTNINDIDGNNLIREAIFGENPKIAAYLIKVSKRK